MDAPQARVQLADGRLGIAWPARASFMDLTARLRLRDGTVHESAGWTAVAEAGERYRSECGPLMLDVELQPRDGCVRVCASATALADVDVSQLGLTGQLRTAGSRLEWVLYNGYQSWDAAGHLPVSGARRESWWTVGLADAAGAGVAAAAVEARSSCTQFTVAGDVLGVVWREAAMPDPRPTLVAGPAGTRWQGDAVLVTAGPDVRMCLESLLGRRRALAPRTVGWLSWYHFGPWVDSAVVLEHSDLLAARPYRDLGYRLVQIDDGWQETYGEWRPNTKFPGGLAAVARELGRRGQVAGLWIAPFLVGAAADVASEAPEEWFVADPETGDRLVDERHRAFGPMYVLDASRPPVQSYLRDLFRGLADAGIRYFKVDFLYAGGYAGLGALRAGMEAIREGVGGATLVASGAPLLPLVGLVDGCRAGPDTATPLYDFETGASTPTIFGDEVVAVARNLAARAFLHRWFQLDADIALVGGNLTLDHARVLVTLAALSGGPFFASDDLRALPPERLSLLTNPEVMELVGGVPARPDWEPAPDDMPSTHWRRGDVLAVFNWSAQPAQVAVRAPGASGARDLWAREELPEFRDGARLTIPAQGVRLLRLR